jgi:hypothetical protein
MSKPVENKKVAILRPVADGGWVLVNKATNQQFAYIGEGLPYAEYLPEGWVVEEDLKNDYKQEV